MFQSFEVTARPEQGPPRLAALRAAMAAADVDAFLVPRADAHQGEYVAPRDERLAWLTGFTGSAGFAAVTAERAAVFADSRYTVQLRRQIAEVFEPVDWPATELSSWLAAALSEGGKIGFDPWLHVPRQVRALREAGLTLTPVANLVDAVWQDQPAPPMGRVLVQPDALAGKSVAEKRAEIAAAVAAAGCGAVVITLPDSLSWLLNLRGADIKHNPVVHGFVILTADGAVTLFGPAEKFAEIDLPEGVTLAPQEGFLAACAALEGKVWADPDSAPQAVFDALAEVHEARDPCLLPKAIKTEAEIAGARAAHLRDAVAMVRFLHWLDANAPGATEIGAATALEGFRRETNQLRDISFETISAAGPHAALPHYRVTTESDRPLAEGEVYLVDSGGQYADGTTDITRTIGIGPQPEAVRRAFTRVLQGMIAVSRLRWPEGLAGADLDAVARVPLWAAGQDYGHGTGHGVGSYLSVHEGPQRLARTGREPFRPGMILSNEPGFYAEGAFGIRIENLIVVTEAERGPEQSVARLFEFETLTFVPIDRAMIVTEMLSSAERDWIDGYHAACHERLADQLDPAAALWLKDACAPL